MMQFAYCHMRCYICTALNKACSYKHTIYCGVEQLVARWAHNPKVAGSSPVPATRKPPRSRRLFYLTTLLCTLFMYFTPELSTRFTLALHAILRDDWLPTTILRTRVGQKVTNHGSSFLQNRSSQRRRR